MYVLDGLFMLLMILISEAAMQVEKAAEDPSPPPIGISELTISVYYLLDFIKLSICSYLSGSLSTITFRHANILYLNN